VFAKIHKFPNLFTATAHGLVLLLNEPESAISPDQDSLVLVATAFFQNGSVRQALHDPFGVATTADGCRIVPFLGAVGCLGHSAVSALAADSVEPHRVGWR
jgi:hypothetical protein